MRRWSVCAVGLLVVACGDDAECVLAIVPPAPDVQFDTNPFSNLDRPDSAIAVGPSHVVTAVNFQMQVQDLDGGNPTSFNLNTFFPMDPTGSVGDPRLIYDATNDRFILSVLGFDYPGETEPPSAGDSWCDIAVSQTGDPRGPWNTYSFNVFRGGTEQMDFDSLGHDGQAIYVTARMRDFADGTKFSGNRMVIIDKATALAGGMITTPIIVDDIALPGGAGLAEIIKPVEPLDAAALAGPTLFLTESGTDTLVLYTVTDPLSTPVFTPTEIPIAVWAEAGNAPQKGGAPDLGFGVTKHLQKTSMRNGVIWTAHTTSVGGRAGVVVYKIDPIAAALIEQHTVSDPALWFYDPAVVADASGNAAVVFAGSDDNHFASIYYTRYFGAENEFESPLRVAAGTATYFPNTDPVVPWGDYFDAAPDFLSGDRVWLHGELPTPCDCSTTMTWTMRAARVTLTTPQAPITCTDPL